MKRRPGTIVTLALLAVAGCGGGGGAADAACPACDACAIPDATADVPPEAPEDAASEGLADLPGDAPAEPGPPAPTYWSAEATRTTDDLRFLTAKDPATGEMKPFFGLGVDPRYDGAWDGVTGPGQCHNDPATWKVVGHVDNGTSSLHAAAASGANYAYLWGYVPDPEYLAVDPPLRGVWHPQYGTLGPGHEAIPIMVCPWGEEDMSGNKAKRIEEMKADFADFQARTGRWSKESAPTLPPYGDLPWYCWHPSFRMIGGGSGFTDYLTDPMADAFAKTTNLLIGDTYTYACNPFEEGSVDAILQGQKGAKGECYDDWLAWDDPDHRSMFSAAWDLAHSLRTRANPDAVVWMWMQGYAFDDGNGDGECWSGQPSTSWASGPFPTMRYLRKEILSAFAAGATGIILFGYGSCRDPEAEKLQSLLRALSHPEVLGPALLSPRLDLGVDTAFAGEGGRAHLLVKWDAATRAAFVLGANPGAKETAFTLAFPWTLAKVERLDWFLPGFVDATEVALDDRALSWTAPADEGFLLRVTPLFEE